MHDNLLKNLPTFEVRFFHSVFLQNFISIFHLSIIYVLICSGVFPPLKRFTHTHIENSATKRKFLKILKMKQGFTAFTKIDFSFNEIKSMADVKTAKDSKETLKVCVFVISVCCQKLSQI